MATIIGYNKLSTTEDTNKSKLEYAGESHPAKPQSDPIKYAVFHVEGGLGKNVAATAVVKLIKESHPDRQLVVVASYPEVFLNNPNVYRVYRVGATAYFYDDFILNKDVVVFRHEPYFQTAHILKQKPLVQNWAELYGLQYRNGVLPEIHTNMVQDMVASQWNRDKPTMVLQTNGGFFHNQKYTYAWTRDMPINVASAIIERYSRDYHIFQICREQRQALPGAEAVYNEMPNMELFSILRLSKKRVLIDSCLQHAAAAFRLPSTVLWVGTSPTVFGYGMHSNLVARVDDPTTKLVDAYLFDYQFDGILHECPYKDMSRMFNLNEVFDSIQKTGQ